MPTSLLIPWTTVLVVASGKHLADLDAGARVGATGIRLAHAVLLVNTVIVVSAMIVAAQSMC